jgi:hypothetical protein
VRACMRMADARMHACPVTHAVSLALCLLLHVAATIRLHAHACTCTHTQTHASALAPALSPTHLLAEGNAAFIIPRHLSLKGYGVWNAARFFQMKISARAACYARHDLMTTETVTRASVGGPFPLSHSARFTLPGLGFSALVSKRKVVK